ncbi:hypothetical protein WJX72_004535 [[Myrmecia] bisecta]|uniref:Uncharacterized protein n=1 Tax=[Myrmecia] bisecta TaxID=41462 RepID=A0AAW1Q730_9CHLO
MKVQNPKVVSRNVSPHRSSAVQVALSEEMVGLRRREHCTLTDLCVEDKQKVAKLIRQVVELGQENQQLAADHGKETSKNSDKIQQLRQRNHDIIRENTNLRSKLTHAFALLRTYQHKVRVMDAAMHASQSSGNSQATAGRLPASLALAAAQPQEAAQPAALAPQPVTSLLAWHLEESAGNGDGDAELDKGRSRVLRFDPSIGKSGAFYFVELDGQMPALSIAGTSDAGLASTEPSANTPARAWGGPGGTPPAYHAHDTPANVREVAVPQVDPANIAFRVSVPRPGRERNDLSMAGEAAPSQRAADRTPAGSDRPKAAKPQGGGYMHRPDGPEPHTADAWMPSKPAAPSSAVVAEMLGRHLGADYFDDALMDLVAEVDSMVSGDEASSVMSEGPSSWHNGDMYEENDVISLISEQEYESYQA